MTDTERALLLATAEAVAAYRLSVELSEGLGLSHRLANLQSLINKAHHEQENPPESR